MGLMGAEAPARILGIGELLWDVFPDGRRLGGAPFNVTGNLRRLGHPAAIVTAVGDDELGRAAITTAEVLGVDTSFIRVATDLPTGTVDVARDAAGGHRFSIVSPAAYESVSAIDGLADRIEAWSPDAILFGTLAQRFAGTRQITGRLAASAGATERLYDVNLREGCWSPELVTDLLSLATIVKVNDDEAVILAGILGCGPEPAALGERIASGFGARTLCVTLGPRGAVLWASGMVTSVEGIPVAVADTVGAGDAFAAALLHGILLGMPAPELLGFANRLGALVASRPGALPAWSVGEVL